MSKAPDSAILLRKILDRVDTLPTIPLVATQIGELVDDPHTDAQDIADMLRNDQALTAKVLRLANSSYYAIPGGVSDVKQAVAYLGFNTLYQLVLSISVLSMLDPATPSDGISPRELWKHSLGTAALSDALARELGFRGPETCFTGGLLHDIGKVGMLEVAPARFNEAVVLARSKGISFRQAELELGLPHHSKIGRHLAERWKFPLPLRAAIDHERFASGQARAALPPELRPIVDITALANILVRRFQFGDPGDAIIPELDPELLERLNLTVNRTESMHDELMRAVEASKVLLDLVGG